MITVDWEQVGIGVCDILQGRRNIFFIVIAGSPPHFFLPLLQAPSCPFPFHPRPLEVGRLHSPSLLIPSPSLAYSISHFLPLRSRPLKSSYGSGERCKFPQWGLGQSLSRNRIWCILAWKYAIWWQAALSVYNMQLRNIGGAKYIACRTNPTLCRATARYVPAPVKLCFKFQGIVDRYFVCHFIARHISHVFLYISCTLVAYLGAVVKVR